MEFALNPLSTILRPARHAAWLLAALLAAAPAAAQAPAPSEVLVSGPAGKITRAELTLMVADLVPAAERDAFLARECVDRPELLAEVRAILTLVDQNREFFEAATRVPSQALESSAGPGGYIDELVTGIDDLIDGHGFDFEAARCAERRDNGEYWMGPYQLVKLLGSGGFGAVFLALRREPVQFYVAIKVIQAGRASPAGSSAS